MAFIRYMVAVAWKELQLLSKDLAGLAILLVLPLMLGSLMAAGNLVLGSKGGEAEIALKVLLVNQDPGIFGSEVAKAIGGIPQLAVETLDDAAAAEARVREGEVTAAIVIPAGFSQQIDAYTPTSITVIVDPAQPESAGIVTGIMKQVVSEVTLWGSVQHGVRAVLDGSGLLASASPDQQRAIAAQSLGAVMTRINDLRKNPTIAVVTQNLEGATLSPGWGAFFAYLFAAFTVMFIFFVVAAAAVSLLEEREAGVLRRLTAAPIPRGAILVGKILAFMVIPCVQVAVMLGVAHFAFKVPLGTSPAALAVLTLVVSLVAVAMGVLLASLVKNAKQADNLGLVLGLVLAMVGGAMPFGKAPMFRQEGIAGLLPKLVPHGYAVEGYYRIMVENAGLVQILPQVAVLIGMAVVFVLIGLWRFKWTQ